MRDDHGRLDSLMPHRPEDPGARRETRSRRQNVIDEQHGRVKVPPATPAPPMFNPPHRANRNLVGDLSPSPAIGPDLRRSPSTGEPVPSTRAKGRCHLDGKQPRMVDPAVPSTPPVAWNRHDERHGPEPTSGLRTSRFKPLGGRPNLLPEPATEPSPRIPVGTVLRRGEHSDDLRRIRDKHRELVNPCRRLRVGSNRSRHRGGQRVVPPRLAGGGASEPGIAHRFDHPPRPSPQQAWSDEPAPTLPNADLRFAHDHHTSPPPTRMTAE